MNSPILSSTAFLTVLLAVGLFFFLRASAKDRTEITKLITEQPELSLLEQLQQYFTERAYRLTAVDAEQNQVVFEGFVRPSLFLAVFLSLLAGVGIVCLTLVLSMLIPNGALFFPLLVLLAPLTGFVYWNKAGRNEKVALQVETVIDETAKPFSLVTVTAHRDEVLAMRRALPLKLLDSE